MRNGCIHRLPLANEPNDVIPTLESHLASLLDDSMNTDTQRNLSRGAFIDANRKLEEKWENIAQALDIHVKTPKSASATCLVQTCRF